MSGARQCRRELERQSIKVGKLLHKVLDDRNGGMRVLVERAKADGTTVDQKELDKVIVKYNKVKEKIILDSNNAAQVIFKKYEMVGDLIDMDNINWMAKIKKVSEKMKDPSDFHITLIK